MYEHHHQKLLSGPQFALRVARHSVWAVVLILGSLAIGILGFHELSDQSWLDALVNAAMLLGGMGPVGDLGPAGGKIFAACYALYAGLVFLIVAGVLFAPVFHRVLHRFHLEVDDTKTAKPKR